MVSIERLCPGCMNDNGGQRICPICGFDAAMQNTAELLPVKYFLTERYMIGQAKRQNGEGITYLGWDRSRDVAVTVREYFPAQLSLRNPDCTVSPLPNSRYAYEENLQEFLEINRGLMGSSLPALTQVTDVFELNGTAYAVEQYVSSITLGEFLEKNGGTLKWEQARPLFLPLIDTVKSMNDAGVVHGGISPDTLLVGRDGKLRITGYGVRKLRKPNADIRAELFDGFAATEQYGEESQLGFSTDVYAISAVLYRVLIGKIPPKATERATGDGMSVPAKYVEELPRHVLHALANGLQIDAAKRTANMETFKNELVYAETAEQKVAAVPVRASVSAAPEEAPVSKEPKKKGSGAKYAVISALSTAAVFLIIIGILAFTVFRKNGDKDSQDTSPAISTEESSEVPKQSSVPSGTLYEVPDIKGKYYADLEDEESLEKFQIKIVGKEYSDQYERGMICKQSIDPGKQEAYNTVIEITISLGTKEIKMPSLLGKDKESAKVELLKAGFLYQNIKIVSSNERGKTPGTVTEQKPVSGTRVSPEEEVTIAIALYEVPNVVGMSEETAISTLTKQGFAYHKIHVKTGEPDSGTNSTPGTVYKQDPKYTTKVPVDNDPADLDITIYIASEESGFSEEPIADDDT